MLVVRSFRFAGLGNPFCFGVVPVAVVPGALFLLSAGPSQALWRFEQQSFGLGHFSMCFLSVLVDEVSTILTRATKSLKL